jgi:hypothetical protein
MMAGTFEESADPVALVKVVAATYAAIEDGYRAQLVGVLAETYQCYLLFLDSPDDFEELLEDPFWDFSRQKPKKKLTTSRWVLYYVMRAETPNPRGRVSKYAKILDCFQRDGVKVGQVPARIRALGGIEAAYAHFVGIERGLTRTTVDADDAESEEERPLTLRRGKLHASGDAKVRGNEIDAEPGSPSETGLDLAVGGRFLLSFDPRCSLIVELDPTLLQRIVDAGTTHGRPVSFHFKITVHPRDVTGFARVVGELEKPSLRGKTPRGPDAEAAPLDGTTRSNLQLKRRPKFGRST